uniref:C-C motif chemokine n=1 Tax=Leptobrachium leishanense TaxID=445787 RepID=A0A8C5LN68_9ANUR
YFASTDFLYVHLTSCFSPAPAVGSDVVPCCFGYVEKTIPRRHVVDYFYTSGRCSLSAVVLITRKNRKFCTNPDTKWVKDHINYLEMKEGKNSA